MQTIAITGASSGIGRELALNLACKDSRLLISSRSKENLQIVANELENLGAKSEIFAFDVSCEKSSYEWCEYIFRQRVDILILNAGISSGLDESAKKQIQITKVNCLGIANTIFYAVEKMQKQEAIKGKKGHIVLIASIASFIALPNAPSYSASKHYVKALGEALSLAYPDICFTVVCPGFIKTNLTKHIDIKNMMSVEFAAKKIVKAIKQEKALLVFPFYVAFVAKIYNILPLCVKKIFRGFFTKKSRL